MAKRKSKALAKPPAPPPLVKQFFKASGTLDNGKGTIRMSGLRIEGNITPENADELAALFRDLL